MSFVPISWVLLNVDVKLFYILVQFETNYFIVEGVATSGRVIKQTEVTPLLKENQESDPKFVCDCILFYENTII
jgi:hypothetical protein